MSRELLEVVTLKVVPEGSGLSKGEQGTIVEFWTPTVYEVEFCDDEGRTTWMGGYH